MRRLKQESLRPCVRLDLLCTWPDLLHKSIIQTVCDELGESGFDPVEYQFHSRVNLCRQGTPVYALFVDDDEGRIYLTVVPHDRVPEYLGPFNPA